MGQGAVKQLNSSQVMNLWFMSSGHAWGSLLSAEPTSDPLYFSLSAPPPLV